MVFLDYVRSLLGGMPRPMKRLVLIGFDIVALAMAVWLSYCLRYSSFFVPRPSQWLLIGLAPAIAIPVFVRMGMYRAVIRYLPERAIWTMLQAVSLAALGWVGIIFLTEMAGNGIVPRSVPIFYWLLGGLLMVGSRFAAKIFIWAPNQKQLIGGQLLIYGAGEAGAQMAVALRSQGRRLIVGFLDDDPALHGRDVAGIRVYSPSHLPNLINNFGIQEVILSMPSIDKSQRQRIVGELTKHPIKIRTLPHIADLLSGKFQITQIREIDIDDLLGRSSISPEPRLLAHMIEGRSILVTGAGGSIGSELCRLIMRWRPKVLVLYEQNEFALYTIERELTKLEQLGIVPVLASIADQVTLERTIKAHAIDVLFHAAAHKHVPLVEANILEGIRNNVFGSLTVTRTAFNAGVKNFVLISSDKAVRPTNVMGATKRWAEFIVRYFADQATLQNTGQKFCAVRFGNVLGSNGSVVPLFKEQIAAGGPVTITDPAMTRYFMSIHEAAELIVQAGALSEGGDIFLLQMGEPVRITDLARNMIQLAGQSIRDAANPGGSIEIVSVGARPGEKLYEELFYDAANAVSTSHPKILRAAARNSDDNLLIELDSLSSYLEIHDQQGAKDALFRII